MVAFGRGTAFLVLVACVVAHAELDVPPPEPPKRCITPLCTWQCVVPKCKQKCTPQCLKPDCHMKCRKQCASCTIHCPPPECKVLCPKLGCPMQGCPDCKIVCDPKPQQRCVAKCESPNPTCWPACNTNCWNKCEDKCEGPDGDHPFCHLICRKPEDFGLICPPSTCNLPCKIPQQGGSGASCCPCTNSTNAQTAMRFANSMPWSADTAHLPRPSLLEVVEHFREQEKRGSPSCCPCAHEHTEQRDQAVVSESVSEDDSISLGAGDRSPASYEMQAPGDKLRRLQASQAMNSYDSLGGGAGPGMLAAEPTERPGPRYPIWPGYPSPLGANKETPNANLPK